MRGSARPGACESDDHFVGHADRTAQVHRAQDANELAPSSVEYHRGRSAERGMHGCALQATATDKPRGQSPVQGESIDVWPAPGERQELADGAHALVILARRSRRSVAGVRRSAHMGEEFLLRLWNVARGQILTTQSRHQVQQSPQTADPVGDLVSEREHYGAPRLSWDKYGTCQRAWCRRDRPRLLGGDDGLPRSAVGGCLERERALGCPEHSLGRGAINRDPEQRMSIL